VTGPLLRVRGLRKHFRIGGGLFAPHLSVRAVDGVDLDLEPAQTIGLVGESGCGKSTLARLILRLIEPDAGTVEFDGRDVRAARRAELRALRREMQIIFQDPYASLNPRMTIGEAIGEGLQIHRIGDREGRTKRVQELLEIVGLRPEHAARYPHEFSGGQRQRIGVARALALEPKLIVADEPVSSLDVSIQAQILNLLLELQQRFGIAYLFISHDLRVVQHLSDYVAVMYLGRIVESASAADVYRSPQHPYDARSGRTSRADRPGGRRAESDRAAAGVSLPPALCPSQGDLQRGEAPPARGRSGAPLRLPLRAILRRVSPCASNTTSG
jgi:ABC-type oligopeptide transport system ATPase subunit